MPTNAEIIRDEVARRIVSGDLEPGTVLDETRLAAEFNVSRTPVREALRKLGVTGLVVQSSHRRTIVAKPDDQELANIFFVMAQLETMCAGQSALQMSVKQRRDFQILHDEMASLVRCGAGEDYALANEAFHSAIYEGTGNAYLAELTFNTRLRLQPFRRAQFATPGRLAASHAEHSAVVEAIIRADRDTAERAMQAHIGYVEGAWKRFSNRIQEELAI
ncbi:MAG: GntR family transcriptional regulator [Hoeflea sp.]|uniref:GntR family transcriptional regulator n=1 Tax=Hoeflea sp. TaxID=1940281 RepID=UPI000C108F26|nr:GntR family transcriptional regulator [Hoeflea sp.]PHR17126.1 MAG: GntR family transcriptional regulator [Hoeflea sp.]